MSDVVVVGSAGFIGSNLCNYLVQHTGYSLASVDNLSTTPDLKNLQPSINSKSRHTFYLAEAESPKIISKMFELEKPKTIIYNLAEAHLNFISDFRLDYVEAIKILRLWLDLAYLNGVEKFIILNNPRCLHEKLTVEEQEYVNACEYLTLDYASKFDTYLLKPCVVFGPRQKISYDIPKTMISVLEGREVILPASRFDLMYIKDFFFNVLSFIQNQQQSGVYYLRNNEWLSLQDVYTYLQGIVSEEPINVNVREPAHISVLNPEAVEHQHFSWVPHYEILNALEHTMCWYEANRWAWRM